jgi:serine/threonine protein kinase/Tfp pilus assembly protein PilF
MRPERWQQIERLFHSALAQEPAERAEFLKEGCAGDEALRREMESLLRSHDLGDSFIEQPASDLAADMLVCRRSKLEAEQRIGHYVIKRLLGEGGMGQVYLAQDVRLDRLVALKLLPEQFTVDAERVRRFEFEARAASALNHPNIVTIHEIGQSGSSHFIATEFIDGETLRDRLNSAPMALGEVLDVAAQVASALTGAHEVGVVHRDIKPENVMLRRDGYVKVLDFGLAKLASRAAAVEADAPTVTTEPNVLRGTLRYMSPEQARGLDVDARTDIWSLGVVLYEMAAGRAPFESDTHSHLILSILECEPPPLGRYSEVPTDLERIARKALSKDTADRYQQAGDMAHDLKSLKQDLEVDARLKRSPQPAYERYLKGRYFFDKRTAAGFRRSKEYFQEAIKKDPNYALAYAGLANACTPSDFMLLPPETMAEAKAAAKKALEIDDTLAEAHTAQARVLLFYDLDWEAAERELKGAIDLNPNYTESHHMYSHYLIYVGRNEQSLAESLQALEIDPLDSLLNVHLGWHYLYARQFDEAIEQLRKAIEMEPSFFRAHLFLARAYQQKGRYNEALAAYQRAMQLETDGDEALVMLGHLYAVSGNKAQAIRTLERLRDLYERKKVAAYDLAVIHAGLGENEQALQSLTKSCQDRFGALLLLRADPVFDSLRSDPRYQELLRSINLTF